MILILFQTSRHAVGHYKQEEIFVNKNPKTIKKMVLLLAAIILSACLAAGIPVLAFDTGNKTGTSPGNIPAVSAEVEVYCEPVPVYAEGEFHLVYELHITNMGKEPLQLKKVEVLRDSGSNPLVTYQGKQFEEVIEQFGLMPQGSDISELPRGTRSVVFIWVTLDNEKSIPKQLNHRITFENPAKKQQVVLEKPVVSVSKEKPVLISSPVVGEGWLSAEGAININGYSHHRFGVLTVEGRPRVPQRFAIDWVKFGPDGKLFRNDSQKNEDWYCYGEKLYAVADGVVLSIKDGLPNNVPLATERAVPMNYETVCGNYVLLDIGGGKHALYAHMIPGSITVKPGDRVKAGHVLGLLGNSGNSDAPHLHFQINTSSSFPLVAEGLPFILASFEQTGIIPIPADEKTKSFEQITWDDKATFKAARRKNEMPLAYRIYTIPR
jgi:murein DD-endopeptidase